jgi:hypothetical protein
MRALGMAADPAPGGNPSGGPAGAGGDGPAGEAAGGAAAARSVDKGGGADVSGLPEEFRDALKAYFEAIEEEGKP